MEFFSDHDLYEITEGIWLPVLNMAVQFDTETGSEADGTDGLLTASVSITGAWQGKVMLQCSRPLLREAAATMFALTPQEAADDELRDTLQELTNMLGGTVKSALPEPCELTLPRLTDAPDPSLPWNRFRCRGEPLRVAVVADQ